MLYSLVLQSLVLPLVLPLVLHSLVLQSLVLPLVLPLVLHSLVLHSLVLQSLVLALPVQNQYGAEGPGRRT